MGDLRQQLVSRQVLIMPNPRACFRRLSPRDPRDWGRNIFIAACLAAVIALLVLLMVHPR